MKLRRLQNFKGQVHVIVSCLVPILAAFLCLQQQCQAQQPFASQSGVSVDPLKYVNWFLAPQTVTLGDVAVINIPPGYRLTDVHGARMILASFSDPIPDDLIGILAPAPGKWMAILEYAANGYIKKPDLTQVDTKAVLKQVLDQINAQDKSSVASLGWQSQPTYDAQRHWLEWSLLVATPSTKLLSRTAALLGRHGVLQVTMIQPFSLANAPSLKQLASDITFKNGERYTDYKSGDKIAELGLTELILGRKQTQTAGLAGGGFGAAAGWIYCGLAICLITGGLVVVLRKNKTPHRHRHRRAHAPVPASAIQNKPPMNSAPSNQMSLALKYDETNGHARPKPVVSQTNWWKPFHHKHRKRVFNHSKFYMNLVSELSRHSYGAACAANRTSYPDSHANGFVHGSSNGHANGRTHSDATNHVSNSDIENLIATLKNLIQEQKYLSEEKNRLIEEKLLLIEEQTVFLKTQSTTSPNQQARS